jgi:PAS domain S-box-containing protein
METAWRWDRLSGNEKRVAELLLEGKSNKDICGEMSLSRARVQECIRRIVAKTGADSTRSAIVLLAEERETAALLRVLEQATDGVAVVQDGIVRFANRALAEIHGYGREEMVGKHFLEMQAPEARELMAKRYERHLSGAQLPRTYRTEILCKGGETKEVRVATVALLRYNGRPALMPVVMDPERAPRAAETAQHVGRCGQPCCLATAKGQELEAYFSRVKLPAHCVWQSGGSGGQRCG